MFSILGSYIETLVENVESFAVSITKSHFVKIRGSKKVKKCVFLDNRWCDEIRSF